MKESFKNRIKRFWFAFRSDPSLMMALIATIAVFSLCFSGWVSDAGTDWLCLGYLIFVALYVVFRKLFQRRLTKCFVMVSYCGNNYVYQSCKKKEIKKLKREKKCKELLKEEIGKLILFLPEGKYVAVTHDYVINILQKSKEFEITHKKIAYTQNLVKLQRKMFDCKKCPQDEKDMCKLRKNVKVPRQFYYIKFEKR